MGNMVKPACSAFTWIDGELLDVLDFSIPFQLICLATPFKSPLYMGLKL